MKPFLIRKILSITYAVWLILWLEERWGEFVTMVLFPFLSCLAKYEGIDTGE